MEAPRGPGGRRTLLPFEVQLIDQLGISVEEYWQFNDAALERVQQRQKGYELIPEIYNEPTTIIAVASLVIGLASTAVGLLLKPKAPKPQSNDNERRNLEGGDSIGRSRFNPRYGFDSVQELATLGKPIPLVFTRRGNYAYSLEGGSAKQTSGGTRVSSQLLWSNLQSGPASQKLRVAALLGLGEFEWRPEYEGLAIGGTKIESYPSTKIFVTYNKNGNRPKTSNQNWTHVYGEGELYSKPGGARQPSDVLYINDRTGDNQIPADSSTNSPTTSTQFGLYNFMPNGTGFRENYRAVMIPYNDVSDEDMRDDYRMEDLKFNFHLFPRGAGIDKIRDENGRNVTPSIPGAPDGKDKPTTDKDRFKIVNVKPGYTIQYIIGTQRLPGPASGSSVDPMFRKTGESDVNQVTDATRADVDDILHVGATYRIGNVNVVCTERRRSDDPPYDGSIDDARNEIEYVFEALDSGQIKVMSQYNETKILSNAYKYRIENGSQLKSLVDGMDGIEGRPDFGNNHPCDCTFVSEVSDAVVSMTRATQMIEIGIKSQVWRQVSISNALDYPSPELEEDLRRTGSTYSLGQLDRYLKRYSFFRLQYRIAGNGNLENELSNRWRNMLEDSKFFCVQGAAPRDQYNFIKITKNNFDPLAFNQLYEFRLDPVAGSIVDYEIETKGAFAVELFGWTGNPKTVSTIRARDGWTVSYNGTNRSLTIADQDILELQRGPTKGPRSKGGVVGLSKYNNGLPATIPYVFKQSRYSDPSQTGDLTRDREKVTRRDLGNGQYEWRIFWNDEEIYNKTHNWSNSKNLKHNFRGYQYRAGVDRFDGNQFPGLRRFEVEQWQADPEIINVISGGKAPLNNNELGGEDFTIKIFSYSDPDDPSDSTGNYAYWEIDTPGKNYENGKIAKFMIRGEPVDIKITTGYSTGSAYIYRRAATNDYPLYEGERLSCETQPEHEIVYINQMNPYEANTAPDYDHLSYLAMHIEAGREFTSFSDFSAYIKRGTVVRRLVADNIVSQNYSEADYREHYQDPENAPSRLPERYATNLLPEIANALLTDPVLGVGEIVGRYQVDYGRMRTAANYCLANGFTWDGVIAERINLREWIYNNALINMLDFVVEGGRFSLVPALLHGDNFKIAPTKKPDIAALFTDGNMKDYKASYLQPEDRQLFTAVVLYRNEIGNGFPTNRSLTVSLTPQEGGRYDIDPVEEFDLSDSVTSAEHALKFAKFALRVRQSVTHTIEFSTTVNEIVNVEPGAYIRVTTESHYHPFTNNNSIRFKNGSIGPQGQITSNTRLKGQTLNIFYWRAGDA